MGAGINTVHDKNIAASVAGHLNFIIAINLTWPGHKSMNFCLLTFTFIKQRFRSVLAMKPAVKHVLKFALIFRPSVVIKKFIMKKILFVFTFVALLNNIRAQTIIVNPDGTHSIMIDNGVTKTIVHPNGTHSTVIDNGTTKTIVNPDGTHSTVIDNGITKTIVNPNGTHSTIIDKGTTKTIVNPDGTHSIIIDNGMTKTIVHPNGTHSTVIYNGTTKTIVNPNGIHSIIIDNGKKKTIVHPKGNHSVINRKIHSRRFLKKRLR